MIKQRQSAGAGMDSIPPDKRRNSDVRKRLSPPAIRTFFNVADRWGLLVDEQRGLLGWPGASTYHKYKNGEVPALSYDSLTRVSLVLGIFKALNILYPEQKLSDRWVKLPNTNHLFNGNAPIEFMIEGGMDGLYKVRRLLDARRGGWN